MIKTIMGIATDYSKLEQILATRLNKNSNFVSPLQVTCSKEDDKLVIIVQYPEEVISQPRQLFRIIRNTIKEQDIADDISIYLEVNGNNQWEFSTQINISSPKKYPLALNSSEYEYTDNNYHESIFTTPKKRTNLPLIWSTIIVIIFGVISLAYIFSRPCVINKCLLIPETKEFVDESLYLLDENNKNISLEDIIANLKQAVENLKAIPSWSKDYSQAQELINNYQIQIDQLNQGLKAIELANEATTITKNSPLSIKQWQEVLKLWQESINILETLNQQDKHSFFEHKKQEYQANIDTVKAKIQQEKDNRKYLLGAKDAAKLAELRQANAQSLMNLQLVEASWKTAIKRLENISKETNIAQEKQELLTTYLPKFVEVKKRRQQEESAIDLYNQALEEAKLAQQQKMNDQLSRSVVAWQSAIELLKKVPSQTFQSAQANKLLKTYERELSKTEAWLQTKLVIEQVKNDLVTICADNPKICNFSVNSNLIKVFLTTQYINIIDQINKQSNSNNINNLEKIKNHIIQLEKNFKYISLKYLIPLEVYHPNGNLIIKYEIKN